MPSMKGTANPAYKHGFAPRGARLSIYYRWQRMIARCYHPSQKDFFRYGARGITVCAQWRFGADGMSGFECWLRDMGLPGKGASMERIDNSKGYFPGNCRWATVTEQANNRRSNKYITARGQTLTIAQWARLVGMSRQALRYRLAQGVPPEVALFTSLNHGVKLKTRKK
jgi:hypothetical protein